MRVIITGATGFIGRNLAEQLLASGHEVIGTGRSHEVGRALSDQGIDFRPADLTDSANLGHVFSPVEAVVHCAGRSGDWGRAMEFHRDNVIATQNVLAQCQRHAVPRLVFISSPSLYYTGRDRLGIREADPLPIRQPFPYGRSKLAAERLLLAQSRRGVATMIFRPRAVYGPHDRTLLPRILLLAERKRFPLIAGGRALVDLTYVGNLVDAIGLGLRAPETAWHQAYNLSNGDPIPLREWFAQVLEIFKKPFRPRSVPLPLAMAVATVLELQSKLPFGNPMPALTRFTAGYMGHSMTLNIDSARTQLGYAPRVGNREGFIRFADWVRSARPK